MKNCLLKLGICILLLSAPVNLSSAVFCNNADVNNDAAVDLKDLALVGLEYNRAGCLSSLHCNNTDVNRDGIVNVDDLDIIKQEFGKINCADNLCSDGTLFGKCSLTLPLYCSSGNLENNCTKCGCLTGNCISNLCVSTTCAGTISGTSGNDNFQIFNYTLHMNGVKLCAVNASLPEITIDGGAGNDIFVTVGAGSQRVIGEKGVDSFWVDSTDTVENYSIEESAIVSLHVIISYYQPWSADPKNESYIGIESLGQDIKDPDSCSSYSKYPVVLFNTEPNYTDVAQGQLGDCFFLAVLASLVNQNPAQKPETIKQSIVAIGDGNFIVRYYKDYKVSYIKIDSDLPLGNRAWIVNGNYWVAMLEKAFAYAQCGWGASYGCIGGGRESETYRLFNIEPAGNWTQSNLQDVEVYLLFNSTLNNRKAPSLSSGYGGYCSIGGTVYGSHVYALIGTNDSTQKAIIFNPWGINYAMLNCNMTEVKNSFSAVVYAK